MANMCSACSAMVGNELAPIQPETPANLARRPDFSGLAAGTFDRIRGLIQSNYSASPRRSMKTAIRSFARHCARLGVSVFRPNIANNPTLIAQEEMILMTWLESLVHETGVQGSTAEGYFSLMKGLHSEVMGYSPPAHSGVFVSRWIPKILRGIRRGFPSKLKGREAHSAACFLPMREKYEFLLKWKELFKDSSLDVDKNHRASAIHHVVSLHHLDLADMLHQFVIETMTACLCRVGEAMPTKERMLKISRSDLTFRYDSEGRLLEAKLMLIPL